MPTANRQLEDAMICVHLLPSVLICVEDEAIKNPAVGHDRVLKTISIFAFHSSLFLSSGVCAAARS
jgi:hypothetical protein